MNICKACVSLNGQAYEIAPHDSLEWMTRTSSSPSFGPASESYKCRVCETWMRRNSERGQFPSQWEATIRTPIRVNGYLVYGEAFVAHKSELYDAAYEIRFVDGDGQERLEMNSGRVSSGNKTHFEALADALQLGVAHAKALKTRE